VTRDEAAALLRGRRCWEDQDLSLVRDDSDAALVGPAPDIILQQRDELLDLVGFMNEDNARSLLEVGTWTGRTVEYLSVAVPGLSRVAVVDTLEACRLGLPLHLPPGTQLLVDSSTSATARTWMSRLPPVDLAIVDGDHSYAGVLADVTNVLRLVRPRFLALHDVTGGFVRTQGPARVWRELPKLNPGGQVVAEFAHVVPHFGRPVLGIGVWRTSTWLAQ